MNINNFSHFMYYIYHLCLLLTYASVFCYHFQRKETINSSSISTQTAENNSTFSLLDAATGSNSSFSLRSYDASYSAYTGSNSLYSKPNSLDYRPQSSVYSPVNYYPESSPFAAPNYALETIPFGDLFHKITTTLAPDACRSSTYRTSLGCYCRLLGQRCFDAHSVCNADQLGDGYCECASGYVKVGLRCVTEAEYNNITTTAAQASSSFRIFSPTIVASCFLPTNAVLGNVASLAGNGTLTYVLTLLSSSPLGDTTKHIDVDPANGNLLYKSLVQGSVINQIYSLAATDSRGNTTTKTFTVAYNCTAPTCAFNFGNSMIVDCLRFTTGDTIVTFLANSTVTPIAFSMSLINSSSRNGNNFFQIGPTTGQIFLQKIPHGGVFVEIYSVSATNAAGQTCQAQTLTLTTTETCV